LPVCEWTLLGFMTDLSILLPLVDCLRCVPALFLTTTRQFSFLCPTVFLAFPLNYCGDAHTAVCSTSAVGVSHHFEPTRTLIHTTASSQKPPCKHTTRADN
ncbi:unnamed protein product, partial [Ectocarpus fasciculatus]